MPQHIRNVNALHENTLTVGDKIADGVSLFVGSWKFVIAQSLIMTLWVVYNTYAVVHLLQFHAFDPFPFVFLNLFMSAEAAYSTPFILMSQNRQAAHDRLAAEEDYRINLKAEAEIATLSTLIHRIHQHLLGESA